MVFLDKGLGTISTNSGSFLGGEELRRNNILAESAVFDD